MKRSKAEEMPPEQQQADVAPASPATVATLLARCTAIQEQLARLRAEKNAGAWAAANGDLAALDTLARVAREVVSAEQQLEILNTAISLQEQRAAEERSEFLEREADAKHRAGLAAAEKVVDWADEFDLRCRSLAETWAKLPPLMKELKQSGASVNTDYTNRLENISVRDRAARAAGLSWCFTLDGSISAAEAMGAVARSFMKAAVRRPATAERKSA